MANRKKPEPPAKKVEYEPTAIEQAALDRFAARRDGETAPRMKLALTGDKIAKTSPDHPDSTVAYALLMEALGTTDIDFFNGLIGQLANAASQGKQASEGGLNFMLSVVKSAKPKDQLEAMLAAQMAAIHMAALTFARRLNHVETIAQQDSAAGALTKLTRTYATQMEALKRYRTGGEQKVTVQHVSVSEGGQAIVGNVTQAAREAVPERPANSTPALTDARKPAMTIIGQPERTLAPLRRGKSNDGRSST